MEVGGQAAHRVVRRRLDRHRLLDRVDAQIRPGKLDDVGQPRLDPVAIVFHPF